MTNNFSVYANAGSIDFFKTLFCAKMFAMDNSDKFPGIVLDVVDNSTGEILYTYENGTPTYISESEQEGGL